MCHKCAMSALEVCYKWLNVFYECVISGYKCVISLLYVAIRVL